MAGGTPGPRLVFQLALSSLLLSEYIHCQIVSQSVTKFNEYATPAQGSLLSFMDLVRQRSQGNQVQQCPCVRLPGVDKCITYDARFQASNLEEAMIAFVDLSMDPRIHDQRVGVITPATFQCATQECRQCVGMLSTRLRQVGMLRRDPNFPFALPTPEQLLPGACLRLRMSRSVPNFPPPQNPPGFVTEMIAAGAGHRSQFFSRSRFAQLVEQALSEKRSSNGRPLISTIVATTATTHAGVVPGGGGGRGGSTGGAGGGGGGFGGGPRTGIGAGGGGGGGRGGNVPLPGTSAGAGGGGGPVQVFPGGGGGGGGRGGGVVGTPSQGGAGGGGQLPVFQPGVGGGGQVGGNVPPVAIPGGPSGAFPGGGGQVIPPVAIPPGSIGGGGNGGGGGRPRPVPPRGGRPGHAPGASHEWSQGPRPSPGRPQNNFGPQRPQWPQSPRPTFRNVISNQANQGFNQFRNVGQPQQQWFQQPQNVGFQPQQQQVGQFPQQQFQQFPQQAQFPPQFSQPAFPSSNGLQVGGFQGGGGQSVLPGLNGAGGLGGGLFPGSQFVPGLGGGTGGGGGHPGGGGTGGGFGGGSTGGGLGGGGNGGGGLGGGHGGNVGGGGFNSGIGGGGGNNGDGGFGGFPVPGVGGGNGGGGFGGFPVPGGGGGGVWPGAPGHFGGNQGGANPSLPGGGGGGNIGGGLGGGGGGFPFGRKKRQAAAATNESILGDRFVINCVERGDAETEDTDFLNLCTICWTWRQLPEDYFPRILNELVCNANDYCLSGWGSCHQRYRNVDVLRRVGNDWRPTTVAAASCCDCKVRAGSEVHPLVLGNK